MTPSLALALALGAAPCSGGRAAYDYPVEIKGPPPLLNHRVAAVAAFSHEGGRWREIPVQIDERNASGDYVLSEGLPFTKETDDGWLDDNDELVFDGRDLGEDFAMEAVPEAIRGLAAQHWKLTLCRGATRYGSILLMARRRPVAWRGGAAAGFDRDARTVRSDLYQYKFRDDNPALLGEVMLRTAAGLTPVIAESRFIMPLVTPFFMPNLTLKDGDFTSSIESWQTGPVRSIVAVGVKYSAFLSLFKLHLFSELVFYRNRFEIPTVVEFIFDPSRFLAPGSGLAYSLKFPEGRAWQIDSNLTPLPAADPDDVVRKGARASATETFRARGTRPDGSFLVTVSVDGKARAQVPPPFIAQRQDFQREELRDHWPWLKKIPGDLGVYLDFSGIRKGAYDFGLDLVLSPKAQESFADYGSVDIFWSRLSP